MIAYFPAPYPDELLYSQLARYYVGSGYTAYAFAAEDLYQLKTVRLDIEFLNTFTSDALQAITRDRTMEEVVLKGTMFPYYGRFLPKERKQRAFQALVSMKGNYYGLLPIPNKKNEDRYLRYCPLCSAEDRTNYGETFWHRTHQMTGLNICPDHKCYLHNSNILIKSKALPMLKSAEEIIPLSEDVTWSDNDLECHIAEYMAKVFLADIDFKADVSVGHFLQLKKINTQYHTFQNNRDLFYSNLVEFHKNVSDKKFVKIMQIDKANTVDFYEVCLLALFLDIPTSELLDMKLPERIRPQIFEGKTKPKSWEDIDKATLPFVKDAIAQLLENGVIRPKKVTVYGIERLLNLPNKYINRHLPQCYAMIKQYEEGKQQFWAREVVWAAQQIQLTGKPLGWAKIYELTSVNLSRFKACLPYIDNYADETLAEQLRGLV